MTRSAVPRYTGSATFARLPRTDEVSSVDVTFLGVPFDSGASRGPGMQPPKRRCGIGTRSYPVRSNTRKALT